MWQLDILKYVPTVCLLNSTHLDSLLGPPLSLLKLAAYLTEFNSTNRTGAGWGTAVTEVKGPRRQGHWVHIPSVPPTLAFSWDCLKALAMREKRQMHKPSPQIQHEKLERHV